MPLWAPILTQIHRDSYIPRVVTSAFSSGGVEIFQLFSHWGIFISIVYPVTHSFFRGQVKARVPQDGPVKFWHGFPRWQESNSTKIASTLRPLADTPVYVDRVFRLPSSDIRQDDYLSTYDNRNLKPTARGSWIYESRESGWHAYDSTVPQQTHYSPGLAFQGNPAFLPSKFSCRNPSTVPVPLEAYFRPSYITSRQSPTKAPGDSGCTHSKILETRSYRYVYYNIYFTCA